MKKLIALAFMAAIALAAPISGYSQDKSKADDKAKQEAKGKSAEKSKAADKAKAAEEIIDINTATAAQLMTLDGIGEARAAAIIKGRPYRGKNELVDRKIVPGAVYEKIKEKMVAHQPAAKK